MACLLSWNASAHADTNELLQKYQSIKARLSHNAFGIPVTIQSIDQHHTLLGVVYGVMSQPFVAVKRALESPQAWCEIVPQHLNVKACTFALQDRQCQLTFYSGRKYYEKPQDVYQLAYRFEVSRSDANYFQTTLRAKKGPMGTSQYRIEVEAIPLTDNTTFLHFSYTYHYNFLTSLAMNTYLATLGSGKVGFTTTRTGPDGKPVYVGGVRGIAERNTIRYYFAIQSYLETLAQKPDTRFQARIRRWFELTERYPQQLHELDKKDYLTYKQQEHADQLQLQKQVKHPCPVPESGP